MLGSKPVVAQPLTCAGSAGPPGVTPPLTYAGSAGIPACRFASTNVCWERRHPCLPLPSH